MTRPVPRVPAPTRLILVEGSIGTGKSTTARLLARVLSDRGTPARAVLEGDVEHPADLESVALLVTDELDELLAEHPGWAGPLRAVTTGNAEGPLVAYGVLERDHGPVPERLAARLRARDVYELPLAEHIRTRLARWEGFVAGACARDEVWVLECCFLQNPLTVTLLRDDAPEDLLVGFVGDLARLAAPLSPVVVHLRADDVGEAFRAVIPERPAWWLDHVIAYYTGRGLGRRLGGTGVEGTVAALRERARPSRSASWTPWRWPSCRALPRAVGGPSPCRLRWSVWSWAAGLRTGRRPGTRQRRSPRSVVSDLGLCWWAILGSNQ